jgi:hypothetical protein
MLDGLALAVAAVIIGLPAIIAAASLGSNLKLDW